MFGNIECTLKAEVSHNFGYEYVSQESQDWCIVDTLTEEVAEIW